MALLAKPAADEIKQRMVDRSLTEAFAKVELHEEWLRNNLLVIRNYARKCADHTSTPLVDLCDLLLEEV